MKKILLPILALGGLLFASSCQMDEPDAGTLTGEVDFSITAGIPSGITTYADPVPAFSHLGGINNVSGDYVLRFILEVYDGDAVAYEETQYLENFSKPQVTFNPRLLAKEYDFVFWADFVAKGDSEENRGDLYYNTSNGLTTISLKDNVTATVLTTDLVDAYYANENVNLTQSSQSLQVTLQRPFGKIRLLATDKGIANKVPETPVSVKLDFGSAKFPSSFNALTGDVTGEFVVNAVTTSSVKEDAQSVDGTTKHEGAYLLGYIYAFASTPQAAYPIDVTVYSDADATSQIGYRELTNIPVSANKLTTVVGNFYTNEGNIDVIVEDDFGSDEVVIDIWDGSAEEPDTDPGNENTYLITTPAELAWVAEQVNSKTEYFEGKTILLMNDIDLSGPDWTPIGNVTAYPTVTFKGTFDGNNHIISNLTASDDAAGYAAAGLFGSILGTVKNVTLKDVNIRSTHYAGAVVGYSSMNGATIENCHVDGGTITSVPENTDSGYDNGDKAGGIIGYYVTGDKVTNCSAKNLTITAYRDFGGIVGCGPESGMTDCSVENIILVQNNTNGYESEAVTTVGALGGRDVNNENKPYDGEYAPKVTKKVVGNVSNAAQLASALTSSASEISVTLTQDIDLPISSLGPQTGGSGEYKLGGESTESITIDLNGKKLNITTDYMSVIGAKNVNAVFTIRNGKMTSSQTSAPWNIYDLGFANCSYTIENVEFLKAIALVNGSSDVTITMNDVTITESNDFYAMWISALGQTVNIDDLTVNGMRGIKIDEQYVEDDAAKVTLNISNSKFTTTGGKAAIMVDSKAGAEINVTNVDISEVKADPVFTVWIDEDAKDHADKVIVNDAKVRIEGSNEQIVATSNEELAAADIADNATIYLTPGIYIIPDDAQGKTLTFIGTGNPEDTKIATQDDGSYEGVDYSLDGATVTFENITINTDSHTYTGYARCKGTYKNCVINGTYTLYGDSKFENCTFNVSGDVYNIWTWGAPNATFDGCIFNSDGKAMLLYGGEDTNLTINNCTFNDDEGLADLKKAAIEIGDDYGSSYVLIVNNTVVSGFAINDTGYNTGTTLWANKNSMPKDRLSVTVDGEIVY